MISAAVLFQQFHQNTTLAFLHLLRVWRKMVSVYLPLMLVWGFLWCCVPTIFPPTRCSPKKSSELTYQLAAAKNGKPPPPYYWPRAFAVYFVLGPELFRAFLSHFTLFKWMHPYPATQPPPPNPKETKTKLPWKMEKRSLDIFLLS